MAFCICDRSALGPQHVLFEPLWTKSGAGLTVSVPKGRRKGNFQTGKPALPVADKPYVSGFQFSLNKQVVVLSHKPGTYPVTMAGEKATLEIVRNSVQQGLVVAFHGFREDLLLVMKCLTALCDHHMEIPVSIVMGRHLDLLLDPCSVDPESWEYEFCCLACWVPPDLRREFQREYGDAPTLEKWNSPWRSGWDARLAQARRKRGYVE